ncbi:Alpha/beta hydrolase fold-3 [Penicillium hispanicum]|uniref:Alpha/beta hydrolase fold-3 n=1 Tax=Penicillium hispanicum TaxID=1080232 RepID=UPI002542222D|nr:Alpha/beta hydrolase fold-3 [Penicillium hispanicum]KAJ5594353.1 Alpha/beta hydrolase fold-3 [Penicillium hispanicum]
MAGPIANQSASVPNLESSTSSHSTPPTMSILTYYLDRLVAFILNTLIRLRKRILATPDEICHIPSREAGRCIKAHVYRASPPVSGPTPVLLNWHGSGFVFALHGHDVDKRDPRISPRFASPERFPRRVLMITADGDSLAPEAEELAERLQAQPEWHVVSQRMQGCRHAWDKRTRTGTPQHAAKDHAYGLAVAMLNE